MNPNPHGAIPDGDEYEPIPDDTETDIDGEHPLGDYPQDIYGADDSEPIPEDAGCTEEDGDG